MLKLCFSSKVRKGTGFVDASEIPDEEEENDEDEWWIALNMRKHVYRFCQILILWSYSSSNL